MIVYTMTTHSIIAALSVLLEEIATAAMRVLLGHNDN